MTAFLHINIKAVRDLLRRLDEVYGTITEKHDPGYLEKRLADLQVLEITVRTTIIAEKKNIYLNRSLRRLCLS